jgi:hypothetical protein
VSEDISGEVSEFLTSVFTKYKPYYVVTVERKGTALLRSALRGPLQNEIGIAWDRILSSDGLEAVSAEALENRPILLIDDGVHIGRRIRQTTDYLIEKKKVLRGNIRIAAFSVHEAATGKVDYRYFGELSDARYKEVRQLMLRQFQRDGSLLLDSEHMQIIVELNCGRLEFYDALCRLGVGVEHVSTGGRSNLTVQSPAISDERAFLSSLPPGTSVAGVVRKIRVVERVDGTHAIIPIFYPATATTLSANDLSGIEPVLAAACTSPSSAFHLVGLYGCLELFKSATSALRQLERGRKLNIRIPKPDDHDPESLSHLKAVFPTVNVADLHLVLEKYVEEGRASKKKDFLRKPCRVDATLGMSAWHKQQELKWAVLSALRTAADCSLLPAQTRPLDGHKLRRGGATFADLISTIVFDQPGMVARGKTARRRVVGVAEPSVKSVDEALLSAALDELIDDAQVVTDMTEMRFADNLARFTRLLRLDGEIVYSEVKKATSLWRQQILPPEVADVLNGGS